ncbi:serine/threonine-protein kinase [Micromonospora radicis]|uniref:non-specific serine/threonine protein kinase n=1 Tax=Micromonospora radicis TaxID=1894971 RepID=A0A418MTM8_9ACTN|nr:serine/threonine-protein kinase [Micromonospora radicis]RIV37667.1 serine/threonine protein kinase [Micromonospora radicis]
MSPLTPNLRLHDRYVLHDRIGLGGMSEVWRADDEILGRPVAVKVLARTLAVDPELRATIRREARAAARLTHPHVTQVYDYGEARLPGGIVPYLVMELVDGRNLADRLADGPLPWPAALRMGAQVAAALAAAHQIGVVHRDVKPGNVMLTETGAKVLDFGIAALAGPLPAAQAGPAAEPIMGTPAYTAPERLRAEAPNPASDVYALGVLLYRTLTGDLPLPVQSWEDALVAHANRRPVAPLRLSGLPADAADLVLACLDPDPSRRPTAGQLAARFRDAVSGVAGPSTTVLPIIATTATRSSSTVTADDEPAGPGTHPPTLVDRTGTWPGTAAPRAGSRSTSPRPSAGRARADGPPGRRPGRPRRPGPAPANALVAAALALFVVLGGLLWLGNRGDESATAAAGATPPTTSVAPSPTRPALTPSTPSTEPVDLRGLATEFIATLTEAQLTDDVDRKAADRLRKDLAKLVAGKPKDREKRIDDLRERIEDEAEHGRIPAEFAARMDDLLDRLEANLPEDD